MKNTFLTAGLASSIFFGNTFSIDAKPKAPSKPKIPTSIILENKRTSELTNFSVYEAGQEDKALSSIQKPLVSGKKIQISLKGLKSCMITLSGSFADGSDASGEIDVCTEKLIRLID